MKALGCALCYVFVLGTACAEYITGNIAGDVLIFTEDTIIDQNASMHFDAINIMAPLYLQNNGQIFSDISICDNCRTYIRNSGAIQGEIQLGQNATVVQVVTSEKDIGALNISTPYELLIYRASDIEWGNISTSIHNADTITIMDSVLYLSADNIYPKERSVTPNIEIIGENKLHLARNDIIDSQPILQNVSGNGKVILYINNMEPLYVAHTVIRDGDMYAEIVRETDYLKILDNDTGIFLNSLRTQNPSDKLLYQLDSATDMSQIHRVLNKSMRINTRRLNQPLKTLGRHIRLNNINPHPIQAHPFVIFGDNIAAYGARTGIALQPIPELQLSMDVYAAAMDFSDTIDDFRGNAIGLNITSQYRLDNLYAGMQIGGNRAYFETPTLKSDGTIRTNPRGESAYITADIGRYIFIDSNIHLIPFVGVSCEYAYVLSDDYDTSAHIGMLMEYKYQATELEYSYGMRISTNTLNINYIDAHIDITSPDDGFTFRSAFGRLYDDMGVSYSVTTSLIFGF